MNNYLLSSLIFLPLVVGLILLFLPEVYKNTFKWIVLIVSMINLLTVFTLYVNFDNSLSTYQFVEDIPWISLELSQNHRILIRYVLGIDGISLPMILLAAAVLVIGAISSFSIQHKERMYLSLYLFLSSAIMGCFVALDFFLFFLFFEFMLLPMYFLIAIWGGENRSYASIKFFIYTLVGSIFILVAVIILGMSVQDTTYIVPDQLSATVHSFDFRILANVKSILPDSLLAFTNHTEIVGLTGRHFVFLLLLIGFGIKLPMVPLHTWLPDAHVEAPTPVSVVLAGILLKVGGYGLLRTGYIFLPDAAKDFSTVVAAFGVLSILYGALNALAQTDLKKLVAYSSVSHMGFVFLGFAAGNTEGISGAIYQMFSHGILSSMLFLVAGVLYDRTHDRQIANYSGLATHMPVYTFLTAIAFFGSLGLPLFSGFIGEFFTLFGAFNSSYISFIWPVAASLGIVLGAAYLLWTLQRMFMGEWAVHTSLPQELQDVQFREKVMLISLAIAAVTFGIFPSILFNSIESTVNHIVNFF